jgi:hypothetical protein
MSAPALALRAAIRARCLADAVLAGLMGGLVRLYDEPPHGAQPVYALFGDAETRDWSSSRDRGHEHLVTLVVWAAPGSAASGLAVADRLATLLDDAPLEPAGHRLVHMVVTATESTRDTETGLTRITLRLRAVTEIAP